MTRARLLQPIVWADSSGGRRADKWLAFPGFWGELQYFHAPTVGTVPFGTSPIGPFDRPLWRDPIGTLATWPSTG